MVEQDLTTSPNNLKNIFSVLIASSFKPSESYSATYKLAQTNYTFTLRPGTHICRLSLRPL